MANYEYVDDVGVWYFHALIESSKFDRMALNVEANHQNKPRTAIQFESTYVITAENSGEFVTLSQFEPEHNVLLFGVHICDSDLFVGELVSSESRLHFPTGPGIGPFLRPPVVTLSMSAFAIPNAASGADWQAAVLASASDESTAAKWPMGVMGQPVTSDSVDNFKAGLSLLLRIAGFDGQVPPSAPANSNYYLFWHATGSVAAYT